MQQSVLTQAFKFLTEHEKKVSELWESALVSRLKFYDAFPKAKPDEYLVVESYEDIMNKAEELIKKNTIIVPHGSFVAYLGTENFAEMAVPTFGNRAVLEWESDRDKERSRIWSRHSHASEKSMTLVISTGL